MKTLNGAPQITGFDNSVVGSKIEISSANEQLREWAESRRCVRCKHFGGDLTGKDICHKLRFVFRNHQEEFNQETFSCAAFSPETTIGSERK